MVNRYTKLNSGLDHRQILLSFKELMKEEEIILGYDGTINQQIAKVFSTLAEQSLDKKDEPAKVRRLTYHVMVECLQNIVKHADDPLTGESTKSTGTGIFLIGKNEDGYTITSGNPISSEKVADVTVALDELNMLNRDELKALYKKQLVEGKLSDKIGAGLGLIDIAKRTGNKLEYYFRDINENVTFFVLKLQIDR